MLYSCLSPSLEVVEKDLGEGVRVEPKLQRQGGGRSIDHLWTSSHNFSSGLLASSYNCGLYRSILHCLLTLPHFPLGKAQERLFFVRGAWGDERISGSPLLRLTVLQHTTIRIMSDNRPRIYFRLLTPSRRIQEFKR